MTTEDGGMRFTVASVMEDVLQQHGNGLRDHDLDSRRAEEAGTPFMITLLARMLDLIN